MENTVVSQENPTSKGLSTRPYRPDDRTSDISLRTGRLKSPKRPPKDPNPLVHPHRSQTQPPHPPPKTPPPLVHPPRSQTLPPPPPPKCPVNVSHKSKSRNAFHLMRSHGALILPKRVKGVDRGYPLNFITPQLPFIFPAGIVSPCASAARRLPKHSLPCGRAAC